MARRKAKLAAAYRGMARGVNSICEQQAA